MWKCPNCGEEIEDQFDSCWKCVKPATTDQPARGGKQASGRFFRHWRRGWMILFFGFCLSLALQAVVYVLSSFSTSGHAFLGLATLTFMVLLVPAFAYWLFVFFFGEKAWPWSGGRNVSPAEETAAALLDEATKLEARGRVKDALAMDAEVAERYPGPAASRDAQKSRENLRTTIG